MSQTTGVAEQLERIADALETHTLLLRQIAESNIGQWECCLRGSGASDALLKVSMLHYKENRPLPERIGEGVGHAGSQPPRGCLYGAWVLSFTPIHRGQPQCLRQWHSRSPPRRQLGSPLLRHMPRLRPRRRFPQRLRKRDGDRQNRRPRGLRFRCGYGVWECVCKRVK